MPTTPQLAYATMYINGIGSPEGWQEGWFIGSDYNGALSAMNTILNYRAAFLSFDAQIVAYKGTNILGDRLSQTITLTNPRRGAQSDSDELKNTMVYSARATNGSKRNMEYRGIEDDWVHGGELTPAGVAGQSIIDFYHSQVWANGFGLKVPTNQPILPILYIKNEAPGKDLILVTGGTNAWPDNLIINLRGRFQQKLLRAMWHVQKRADLTPVGWQLVGSAQFNVFQIGGGTAFQYLPGFSAFVPGVGNFNYKGVSTRETGGPFPRRRGKRPARVSRR